MPVDLKGGGLDRLSSKWPVLILVVCLGCELPTSSATRSARSYEAYLEGRRASLKRTSDGLRTAKDLFVESTSLDPEFAKAHAAMASTCSLLALYGVEPPADVFPRAEAAARRAIEIDPSLSEAWASLGLFLYLHHWDFPEAEEAFRKALEKDSLNGTAHHWYAMLRVALGDYEDALDKIRKARALEPSSRIIRAKNVQILRLCGELEAAETELTRYLKVDSTFAILYRELGEIRLSQERLDEAIDAFEKANQLAQSGLSIRAWLGYAYAVSGRTSEAYKVLDSLESLNERSHVPATYVALVAVGLDDKDRALSWLEEGLRRKDPGMVYIKSKRVFEPLHENPRFIAICEAMGL